jgi:TnpA family transposase
MALAKLLGFDLCPRLKALKDRHLFPPRGTAIRASVHEICSATVDLERIRSHWDETAHLVAPCIPVTPAPSTSRPATDRRLAAIRSTKPSSTSADYCAPCSCVTIF